MPPAAAIGVMAGGALLNAYGQRKQQKALENAAAQGTTHEPWAPAQPNLEFGLSEARRLYEGQEPLPMVDYGEIAGLIPGQEFLPGGSSYGGGMKQVGGGAGTSGGGGGATEVVRRGGGRNSVGFGGGIPGLNKDYEFYMSGQDFANMDSPFFQAYSDAARRAVERAYAPRYDAVIDAFDPGMMPTSIMGKREAEIEGATSQALADSVLTGYGDFRGQNIGLLESTMGTEQNRIAAEQQAAAQRYAARQAASATRYSARLRHAADMAGIRAQQARTEQEAAQWAYQQRLYLSEADRQQQLAQHGAEGGALDDFLRRSTAVGGLGGKTVGPPPVGPNPYQTLGSTAMGIGTMGLVYGGGFGSQPAVISDPAAGGWYPAFNTSSTSGGKWSLN